MKIIVNDKYFVEKDEYSYSVKERTGETNKEGKEINKTHGYFHTLDSALHKIRNITIEQKHEEISILDYIREMRMQTEILSELLKEV